MAVLELTTRGTPQMYYGEELGMRTTDPARIEDVHDPIGKLGWPKEKGRDGERTPMQWDVIAGGRVHHRDETVAACAAQRLQLQRRGRKQRSQLDLQHLQTASGPAENRGGAARRHRRKASTKSIPMSSRFFAEPATDRSGRAEHERPSAHRWRFMLDEQRHLRHRNDRAALQFA